MKLIALDVGEKRIGVARADTNSVKIAIPSGMIPVDGQELSAIVRLCKIQNIDAIIIGMPRNLQGKLTAQSDYVKTFAKTLEQTLQDAKPNGKFVKIHFQDESLTSVQARENLKNKGYNKKAGDIDAEAATLILQDFLDSFAIRLAEKNGGASMPHFSDFAKSKESISATPDFESEEAEKPTRKADEKDFEKLFKTKKHASNGKRLARIIVIIAGIVFIMGVIGVFIWYRTALSPVVATDKCTDSTNNPCASVEFIVKEGSVAQIAESLQQAGLIKNAFAFKIYAKLAGHSEELQAGSHLLSPSMSAEKIYGVLREPTSDAEVFSFTVLPGETIKDIKKRLLSLGYYTSDEINAAFSKVYNHPVLSDKPADASLEGYLFGETYEFYQADSVETIITRMLDELNTVVEENHLRQKFADLGYNLHEGIILASIVQKEAGTVSEKDQKIVAGIFLSRLKNGMSLGSDVTASYAADLVDPDRLIYTDNATVLDIDSCFNTRKFFGLPCGAISNPGATVLISTANPTDTTYLYFLTGDDGLMYYSNTEAEHLQNAAAHCQVLCNAQL